VEGPSDVEAYVKATTVS